MPAGCCDHHCAAVDLNGRGVQNQITSVHETENRGNTPNDRFPPRRVL